PAAAAVSHPRRVRIAAGATLRVSLPLGDVTLDEAGNPILLISAGIGNTPLIGMLGHLAETGSTRQVVVVHGDRSQRTHALRSELERFAAKLRSEEHTSELQSRENIVCRLLLEKKNRINPAFNSIF